MSFCETDVWTAWDNVGGNLGEIACDSKLSDSDESSGFDVTTLCLGDILTALDFWG